MERKLFIGSIIITTILFGIIFMINVYAGDLDDGISSYTDESISGDDEVGKKDTNINFIVVNAIGKSKVEKQKTAKNSKKGTDGKSISNIKDGKQDNNQNSVVVESGSKVDNVYNIIIEK